MHDVRIPGETADYRTARDRLLQAEKDLRDKMEEVAALRRELPVGEQAVDYTFSGGDGNPVSLLDLFGEHSSLLLYSFMFSDDMPAACSMCTAFLDALNGSAEHLRQNAALAVVAKSPIERLTAYAAGRGWNHLPLVSAAGTTYQTDYHAETEKGFQLPMMNVFVKRDGEARHFWASELFHVPCPEGQHARHLDVIWPLWSLLDLTPEGRPDWFPAREYGSAQ